MCVAAPPAPPAPFWRWLACITAAITASTSDAWGRQPATSRRRGRADTLTRMAQYENAATMTPSDIPESKKLWMSSSVQGWWDDAAVRGWCCRHGRGLHRASLSRACISSTAGHFRATLSRAASVPPRDTFAQHFRALHQFHRATLSRDTYARCISSFARHFRATLTRAASTDLWFARTYIAAYSRERQTSRPLLRLSSFLAPPYTAHFLASTDGRSRRIRP